MQFLSDIVIDLGSYQTRVMDPSAADPKVVPSCMVLTRETQKVVSIGKDAKEIVGRSALELEVLAPIKEGNFTDYRLAKLFLEYCFSLVQSNQQSVLQKHASKNVGFGTAYFFVHPNLNEVHHRALLNITKELGVHRTILLQRPLLASLARQNMPLLPSASSLQLLIDCGYESTTFSILQFEKVFHFRQFWYGGKDLTKDIQHFLKITHHLEIGSQSAEKLKHECASVLRATSITETRKEYFIVVRGRDVMSSLPKSIKLSASEFLPLFQQYVETVLSQLTTVTEELGPELIEELIHRGFLVFGGMAVVDLLCHAIEEQYGTSVFRPPTPDLLYLNGYKEYLHLTNNVQKQYQFSL